MRPVFGTPEAHQQGLATRQARLAEWATFDLRQDWADEAFMRGHLRAAGIRIGSDLEPATVGRIRSLLTAAGVSGVKARVWVLGDPRRSLSEYLALNPRLPLWAALALILEATGRFTSVVTSADHMATVDTIEATNWPLCVKGML